VDLEALTGLPTRPLLRPLLERASNGLEIELPGGEAANPFRIFLMDRLRHLMESRGLHYEEIQVVTGEIDRIEDESAPALVELARAWKRNVGSQVFKSAAEAHKRAKKIVEQEWNQLFQRMSSEQQQKILREPAEVELRKSLGTLGADIDSALSTGQPDRAIQAVAAIQPHIARFFDEVRVVVSDADLKVARLSLLRDFSDTVSRVGDPSVLASQSG